MPTQLSPEIIVTDKRFFVLISLSVICMFLQIKYKLIKRPNKYPFLFHENRYFIHFTIPGVRLPYCPYMGFTADEPSELWTRKYGLGR